MLSFRKLNSNTHTYRHYLTFSYLRSYSVPHYVHIAPCYIWSSAKRYWKFVQGKKRIQRIAQGYQNVHGPTCIFELGFDLPMLLGLCMGCTMCILILLFIGDWLRRGVGSVYRINILHEFLMFYVCSFYLQLPRHTHGWYQWLATMLLSLRLDQSSKSTVYNNRLTSNASWLWNNPFSE